MAVLRSLDAFAKPREDLRNRSVVGGLITLVAASAAVLLFLGQVILYFMGGTRHSLHLAESLTHPVPRLDHVHAMFGNRAAGTIPLTIKVTFPRMQCDHIDVAHDGASFRSKELTKLHGARAVSMRTPTPNELSTALGGNLGETTRGEGCTISGHLNVAKVGGTLSVTVSKQAWAEATAFFLFGHLMSGKPRSYNVSHHVHSITFGEPFPLSPNPLIDASHMVDNESGGIALAHIMARLIPTRYQSFFSSRDTYQVSVSEHVLQPETLVAHGSPHLPGLVLVYDFSPLAVHHVEARDNIFVFVSSLVSIVGGVFVTVGLVTGCLVHSAAAVAKKMD